MAIISKKKLKNFSKKANDIFNRTIDQHVTLAVTGLSRSGKTAFITSMVNQLLNEGSGSQLSFFDVVHQDRYIGAKRLPQKHLHISRFEYEGAMQSLCDAQWPKPTNSISELRIAIRYQPKESLLKYATDAATLFIDITDYPGEWLLDLPMLSQSYQEWSQQMASLLMQSPRAEKAQEFIAKLKAFDPFAPVDENVLAQLSQEYTQLLLYYRHTLGLSVIQPGRFILPGDLKNAPILQFFPFIGFENIDNNDYKNAQDNCYIGMLRTRFNEYKERVIRRFYKEHFMKFDRQIVLADCLTPLNNGAESFADLQNAMAMIMQSFQYGQSSLLSRLFSPKIDRLLFAATKADHVTPEQHPHLVSLLNKLVYHTKQTLSFDTIKMETLALASVKATKVGKSQYQGKTIPVIQGRKISDDKKITLFPGAVPENIPKAEYWQQQAFNYINFSPVALTSIDEPLAHLRMDQALQFLLGDKLK